MFGARGDGVSDDSAALQKFFTYTAQTDCGCANMDGVFRTSAGLIIGPASGSSATLHFSGRMKITAAAAIEKIVTIQGLERGVWDGILEVNGTGGATPSTRTCTHCIVTGNSTGRFRIGGIIARFAKGFGLYIQSDLSLANQNTSSFGHVQVQSCGMSYATSQGLPTGTSTTFSARSDTGSSGSVGQRSILTVAALPDTWIDATVGTQHFIIHDGAAYYITAVDRPNNQISVFPWLPIGITSGTIYYATGGGVYTMGGNAGQLFFQALDVSNSAIGVGAAALYGSDFASAQVQANAIGIALGAGLLSGHVASTFTKSYFENNVVDVLRVTRAVPPSFYATFITPALNDISKMKALPARLSGGDLSTTDNSFEGILGLNLFDGSGYEKQTGNALGASSSVPFKLDSSDKSVHVRRTSASNVTVALAYDAGLHAIYGYDSGHFYITGTGASGEFTGSVIFDPPSGHTINGGVADATKTFSSLTGPAHFLIFRNGTNWEIHKLAG